MRNKFLEIVDSKSKRHDLPDFRIGDLIKVHVSIKEGNKERIQIFEGLVIAIKNQGASKAFTVRKLSYGIGIERTFPINSPIISKIEVMRSNKVRRSKLYYMRDLVGKAARLKEVKRKKPETKSKTDAKSKTAVKT